MEPSMKEIVWSTRATSVTVPLTHQPQVRRQPQRQERAQAAGGIGEGASRRFDLPGERGECSQELQGRQTRLDEATGVLREWPPEACRSGEKELLGSLPGVVSRAFHIAGGDA